MPNKLFLASLSLAGLPAFLDRSPSTLRLLYIPTAANIYDTPDFAYAARATLVDMGFQIEDLDLENASSEIVEQAVDNCDVVYVGGGNTYYLLDWVNKSGFRRALARREDVVYVGGSAGAVIAAPDVSYVGDIDDPGVAPTLESTEGLGLIDVRVMPHADHEGVNARWDEVIARSSDEKFARIRDDQALAVIDGQWHLVNS